MSNAPNYTRKFFVNRHDADFMGYLKPGTLLRYAQQVATDQCTALGFDPAFYEAHHCAFLLAKQGLVFHRVPRIDETLTVTTVPEKAKRAVNRRITLVEDESGALVAEVHSWWVLVDLNTRHIMRHGLPEVDQNWNDTVEATMEYRMPKAAALTDGPIVTANYQNCDLNQHLNNCEYADMACATVPIEEVRSKPITKLMVTYHREIPLGGTMQLQSGPVENGWYTCGTRLADGLPAFEAYCCAE